MNGTNLFKEINNVKIMVVTREEGKNLKIITAYIPKDRNYNQGTPIGGTV